MSPYAKGESQTEIDESIERLLMRAKSKHFCFFFFPVGLTRKGKMASSAFYSMEEEKRNCLRVASSRSIDISLSIHMCTHF